MTCFLFRQKKKETLRLF